MKLALFYSLVAVAYLALSLSNRPAAETAFPFVALLLLAPALYSEFLRVKGHE